MVLAFVMQDIAKRLRIIVMNHKLPKVSEKDITTMALTVWGESRGQSQEGQRAVANVIKNRWLNPGWWSRQANDGINDDTIEAVCKDAYQFSCWNKNDPNRQKLEDSNTQKRIDFKLIKSMCTDVIFNEKAKDQTLGADHYCTLAVAKKTVWAQNRVPTVIIGDHAFYKIGR